MDTLTRAAASDDGVPADVEGPSGCAFPVLQSLDLEPEHWELLSRQGFVCSELRGRGRRYFKLRYRQQGRQVVRYLGIDPVRAARAAAELNQLQAVHHQLQACGRAWRAFRIKLRQAKWRMQPLLLQLGLVFHGNQIRRPKHRDSHRTFPS